MSLELNVDETRASIDKNATTSEIISFVTFAKSSEFLTTSCTHEVINEDWLTWLCLIS